MVSKPFSHQFIHRRGPDSGQSPCLLGSAAKPERAKSTPYLALGQDILPIFRPVETIQKVQGGREDATG